MSTPTTVEKNLDLIYPYLYKNKPLEPIFETIQTYLDEQHLAINIDPVVGAFLSVLVQSIQASKVIEIGSLAGYSALWLSKGLSRKGKVWTLEIDPDRAKVTQNFVNQAPWLRDNDITIECLAGDAKKTLESLENQGPFDFVFIDADKAGYTDYLDWADSNVRSGGIIVGDNTLLSGAVAGLKTKKHGVKSTNAMIEFNSRLLLDEEKYVSVCLPLRDGITIGIKK